MQRRGRELFRHGRCPVLMKVQALILLLATSSAVAQSTFQNLDFEDAIITATFNNPPGYYSTNVTLPGWTSTPAVVYDTLSLGGAFIVLQDTPTGNFPVIFGNYSIYLVPSWVGPVVVPALA